MLRATCDFQSSTLGNVEKGDPIEHNQHGRELLSVGLAERAPETKTVERKPGEPGKQSSDPKKYSTKVVKQPRKTKTKGTSRGRKRKRSDSADG